MDIQHLNWPHLEPIQEESEQEDELEGSATGEREDEDFQIQVGVETNSVAADDKSDEDENEDDSTLLRVLRPRRLSRSHSRGSIPQMQFTVNQQEIRENSCLSEGKAHTVGLSDEAAPRKQAWLRKRSTSDELRIKISKIRWQKCTPLKPPVKRKNRKKSKGPHEEPFPKWLMALMVNIEEATTHQLVVE